MRQVTYVHREAVSQGHPSWLNLGRGENGARAARCSTDAMRMNDIKDPSFVSTLSRVAAFAVAFQRSAHDPYMTMPQLNLLLQLYVHGEISQQELPKYTLVAKSANSRNIAKLGDGERPTIERGPGWVESFEDPMDRRNKIVRLTSAGRKLLEDATKQASGGTST